PLVRKHKNHSHIFLESVLFFSSLFALSHRGCTTGHLHSACRKVPFAPSCRQHTSSFDKPILP
uniref:Uncharacterized protein n=1 Tax=Hucho hucho TaxID=62062 RepID=A0A4W5PIB4_9TELE